MPLEETLLPINLKISFKNETDKLLGYSIRENSDSLSLLTYCKYYNLLLFLCY